MTKRKRTIIKRRSSDPGVRCRLCGRKIASSHAWRAQGFRGAFFVCLDSHCAFRLNALGLEHKRIKTPETRAEREERQGNGKPDKTG